MNLTKIRTILFAITGMLVASSGNGQTWEIGYQSVTFVDSSRGNRQIEAELFYPTDVTGVGVPLGSPIDKKYPVIVFGHDQETAWNNYSYVWNKFATQGFIVVVPKTEMGPTVDVIELAKDLAFIASEFNVMRNLPGSFFYQRLNGKSCFMGHGVGGSAATFAVQYYPAVTTLVSLAATETVPSAINAATLVTVPSVVISGDNDCIAPAATHQMPMFNNIDSQCKTFVNIYGATHCNFSQDAIICTIGCPPGIHSWQYVGGGSSYLVISFLRYYMKSNAPALAKFEWKLFTKQNAWSYIFDCNLSTPRLSMEENEMENTTKMSVYPNPVNSGIDLNLVVGSEESSSGSLIISDLMGKVVLHKEFSLEDEDRSLSIPTAQFSNGYYIVSVISREGRISKPLIIN